MYFSPALSLGCTTDTGNTHRLSSGRFPVSDSLSNFVPRYFFLLFLLLGLYEFIFFQGSTRERTQTMEVGIQTIFWLES